MKDIKRNFWYEINRFLEPAFKLKSLTLKALVPVFSTTIITITLIQLIKVITNNLSEGKDIGKLLIVFVLLSIFNYLLLIISRNWTHALIWPMFRSYLYRKHLNTYLYLDNNHTEKVGTGKLIAMIDKGLHSQVDLLNRVLIDVLPNVLTIIFGLIFVLFINVYYSIIVFIAFLFIFIFNIFIQGKSKKFRSLRRDSNIFVMKEFVKILMSKMEIIQNGKFNTEVSKIENQLKFNASMNEKIGNYRIFLDIFIKFVIDFSKVFLIIFFGYGLWENHINFGEFVSLMSILYVLDNIITSLTSMINEFSKIYVDIEKLWDFFDTTPEIKGYEDGKIFKHKNGSIEIRKLSYGYDNNKKIFDNFNLKIEGEKITALVGHSGSGKSTLVKLISGYIMPDSGNIIIDGQKLSDISLKSYYKDIGYLTQEPSIFDGSIYDNLTYAISEDFYEKINEKLDEVIKKSGFEFIYELADGVYTEIGERGVRLSGGQRQRLAIAKIMLKDPKIIILDEPTSALDSFSEELITKAMNNLFKGRTVIVIAHRLQTVKHADRILVIENGKVVEEGTHSSLIHDRGIYKKMLDLQSGF